ncbi:MAG: 2Fe-2S iron-sulfur cluster binding domain-containing protein [Pseudomonadota bacterium]
MSSDTSPKPQAPTQALLSQVFRATLEPGDISFEIPAGSTLLQAAELAGLQAASSCRNGTCRTCICQLVSGEVVYKIKWPGLSLEEKREGYILPCVAYAVSDLVIQLPF